MSQRLLRISLLIAAFLTSEVWAIGLGDIRLDSALNEPLRAEIALLSASPEELAGLDVSLASSDVFERYGIDRPYYLQELEFNIVRGGVDGSTVQIRSRSPMTEPFLTFLVEANWSSGRLLREYTVLLDPPTYTPPAVQQPRSVAAPERTAPSDSGRIEQPEQRETVTPSVREPAPEPAPERVSPPRSETLDTPYATTPGDSMTVARGETLWAIASRVRPDSRLTMNQTMVAIYEANRDAFGGNINLLRAGATLRIPSADEILQIGSGQALSEVRRQNEIWGIGAASAGDTATRPSLTLVPPDEEPAAADYDDTPAEQPLTREQEIENRIAELEAEDLRDQPSLIQIRDNELAALRQELAELRGEVYEPPATVDDVATDETAADDAATDEAAIDDSIADDGAEDTDAATADDAAVDDAAEAAADDATTDDSTADEPDVDRTTVVRTRADTEEGLLDKIIGFATGLWGKVIAGVVVALALLLWLLRRRSADDDSDRPWETLDADDLQAEGLSSTQTIQAPVADEAIVVVEQDSGVHAVDPVIEPTVETPMPPMADGEGQFGSLEDTFSSDTAVNLDQTDPIAEADFHMAYGLYDQAADLINGALESNPTDRSLISKLCEIYFVWGNRDAFIDAAANLKSVVGDDGGSEWNKIVIMGQQIAADHELFAGADVAGATGAVDLSFDDGGDEAGALDMEFGDEDTGSADVVDLGAGDDAEASAIDFPFEDDGDAAVDLNLDATAESPTIEADPAGKTVEMESPTVETPTIEEQFDVFGDGTSELPSLGDSLADIIADDTPEAEATAEINLDELDLGVGQDAETELASLDSLDDTGINEALDDEAASGEFGNFAADTSDDTGVREGPDFDESEFDIDLNLDDLESSGLHLAADETGQSPTETAAEEAGDFQESVDVDDSLLDATGITEGLSDEMSIETGTIEDDEATMLAPAINPEDFQENLADDAETMMASLDDDSGEFDFARTEALPADAFTPDADLEETAETPTIAETDVDLDLDDLTAALQVSDVGDTVEQPRDDATVEQPRPDLSEAPTMSLGPDDMSDELREARTMTEVGTKLDLARAYVDMGDPAGARGILEEVLEEGDDAQKQQAQQLLDSLS